jgi:long-chain acyl-CoA synthetase
MLFRGAFSSAPAESDGAVKRSRGEKSGISGSTISHFTLWAQGGKVCYVKPMKVDQGSSSPTELAVVSLAEALWRRASRRPDPPALMSAERTITYGELWERAAAAAAFFAKRGVDPTDRVLLMARSIPAFAFAYFATHLARAVAVPIDDAAPAHRLRELVRRTRPKLVIAADAGFQETVPDAKVVTYGELERLPPGELPAAMPKKDDLADVLFTSGTTEMPKGVMLTHGGIAAAAANINSVIGNGEDDIEVVPMPLNHSFGLARLRCCVLAGGSVVFSSGARMPGEIFTALERHRATGLVGVPAAFAMLLRFGERGLGAYADCLRYVEIGSAPMPLAHKRRLMELLPRTALWMHYGLTEASRSTFLEFHRHADKLHTVGRPSPGVEVGIRDEGGREVGVEQLGVLYLRSPAMATGYWGDPALTAATFADGWVCTGDVGHLDDEGFLHLHGRRDDMINVGGNNVSPEEVERVLTEHAAVGDAACIAIPDPKGFGGSAVKAFLVAAASSGPAPSRRELRRWVSSRLERYKVPTEYEWIPSIPRTSSGKIHRASLRAARHPPSTGPEGTA